MARGKFLTSPSSLAICAESQVGGGPGRSSLPEESAHVRQVPVIGSAGFVPRHEQGPVGIAPVNTASEPSARARDHYLGHCAPKFKAGCDVARILEAGQ